MKNKNNEFKGGARIGGLSISYPFAKLKIDSDIILFNSGFKKHQLIRNNILNIEAIGFIPIIGHGIKIEYSDGKHTNEIIFWPWGKFKSLITCLKVNKYM